MTTPLYVAVLRSLDGCEEAVVVRTTREKLGERLFEIWAHRTPSEYLCVVAWRIDFPDDVVTPWLKEKIDRRFLDADVMSAEHVSRWLTLFGVYVNDTPACMWSWLYEAATLAIGEATLELHTETYRIELQVPCTKVDEVRGIVEPKLAEDGDPVRVFNRLGIPLVMCYFQQKEEPSENRQAG